MSTADAPHEVYRQNFAENFENGGADAKRGAASLGVPCTAHRSVDQIDGSLECGVYSQIRGVEQVRVGRLAQGRRFTVFVPFIATPDIGSFMATPACFSSS